MKLYCAITTTGASFKSFRLLLHTPLCR